MFAVDRCVSARERTHPRRRGDEGALLVVVMLILLSLLGLGMAGVFLTGGNLQMATNANIRNQALYVAEAGLERARDVLTGPVAPDLGALLSGLDPDYEFDEIPDGLDSLGRPNRRGAILRDTAGVPLYQVPYPTSVVRSEAIPSDNPNGVPNALMGTYTIYIRNDTAECRLRRFTEDGNQVVVIRSEGLAFDGRTRVVLEATMAPNTDPTRQPPPLVTPKTLCNSGKNACDDNSSVLNDVVVN